MRPWGAPRGCAQRLKAHISRGAHPRHQTAAPAWATPKGVDVARSVSNSLPSNVWRAEITSSLIVVLRVLAEGCWSSGTTWWGTHSAAGLGALGNYK